MNENDAKKRKKKENKKNYAGEEREVGFIM